MRQTVGGWAVTPPNPPTPIWRCPDGDGSFGHREDRPCKRQPGPLLVDQPVRGRPHGRLGAPAYPEHAEDPGEVVLDRLLTNR